MSFLASQPVVGVSMFLGFFSCLIQRIALCFKILFSSFVLLISVSILHHSNLNLLHKSIALPNKALTEQDCLKSFQYILTLMFFLDP